MKNATKAALAALTKSTDQLRAVADKLDKDALELRAENELGHLQGTLSDHVALLMAIDGIDDARQRENALAALKLPDGLVPDADAPPRQGTPDAELDDMAKAHKAANPDVTIEAAYSEVLATAKGQALYNKCVSAS